MHFIEMTLCEKIGKVLVDCNALRKYDSIQLFRAWLESDVFDGIIDWDVSLFSQAKSYIARMFLQECESKLSSAPVNVILLDDVMFWVGYLVTYWCLEYQITGRDISRDYDIEEILYAYDPLHTLSIKAAISKIKEDYFCGRD